MVRFRSNFAWQVRISFITWHSTAYHCCQHGFDLKGCKSLVDTTQNLSAYIILLAGGSLAHWLAHWLGNLSNYWNDVDDLYISIIGAVYYTGCLLLGISIIGMFILTVFYFCGCLVGCCLLKEVSSIGCVYNRKWLLWGYLLKVFLLLWMFMGVSTSAIINYNGCFYLTCSSGAEGARRSRAALSC